MYEYIIKILTYDSLFSGHLDSMRSGSSIDTSTRHAWITRTKKAKRIYRLQFRPKKPIHSVYMTAIVTIETFVRVTERALRLRIIRQKCNV